MNGSWRDSIRGRHRLAREQGRWRIRKTLSTAQGVVINVGQKKLINFSSNDYLGLANHEQLKRSCARASIDLGRGSGASHLVCGHLKPHQQFEEAIAEFVGAQRALLFSNGYMANLAVVSAFLSKGDLLLQDKLNHASLIDGARLSAATSRRYAHGNLVHAEALLNKADYNHCMIASDGVFSMDGDIAPLKELNALALRHQSLLLVDDAHGFGVLGKSGQGALEAAQLTPSGETIMMATLSKAMGGYGAFVAADDLYIEHLVQFARSYIYTTALPPSVAASGFEALRFYRERGSELRSKLQSCLLYTSPSPRDLSTSRMPSSA